MTDATGRQSGHMLPHCIKNTSKDLTEKCYFIKMFTIDTSEVENGSEMNS